MPSSLGFRGCAVFVVMSSFAVYLAATPLDPTRIKNVDLKSWIRHYEPALYDPEHLHAEHHRAKRNVGGNSFVRLTIKGRDRIFNLKLTPDRSIFTEDVVVESTNGPIDFEPNSVYTGTLEDDDSALVHGIITKDGLFDGSIQTNTEEYYIEPLSRYANNVSNFHSIVYRERDVLNPSRGKPCASHSLHLNRIAKEKRYRNCPRARLKRWLLEGEAKQPFEETTRYWNPTNNKRFPFDQPIDEVEIDLANRTFTDASGLIFGSRNVNKRASIDPKKTTCMLYLQADHQFFQKYGTEEACIEVMTRHVQRVNSIYKTTDFNQDGKPDNISFMVKRIKVHTTDALRDIRYRFPNNYGVEKFLELFSEEDYDAFCLAYMFTYRDFEMGTLGLAWTGDLKNAGGVCEKNGHYRGSLKSLNTGIVTLLNYGKHVPPAVSHVTLAHEIGHNFGSPHDPEVCTPGGEDGNFIMFARATSGDKKNNNHFSPCSLKSINPVLNFKARSPKGCFTEPQTSLCGNGVVEDGEECDCGWEGDCKDDCCWPQRKIVPIDEPPCKLRGSSICSPSQGPCCTSNCQLKFGNKCRDDNGCRDASFCDGHGPKCPPSINKPNKTICNNEFVCFMGECTGSICLAYGLESCQCIPNKNDPKTKACELCCKLPGDNQPCISSFKWNEPPYDIPDMFSKPGTPCNDYNGYCDVFQMCREVDPSGPLATLRKMLLSEESIASFRRWVMDYWYVVALIILAVIGLLILSTKLLGKRPNVKVKSVTIIHSQTTETVRLPEGDGQVTVHPPLRSKLPLKRKVRNGKKLGRKPAAKKDAQNNNNNMNSPTKKGSPKKKMRVSAAISAEESRKKTGDTTAVIEIPPSKVKKSSVSRRKAKKKKEVIDYSCAQIDNGNNDSGKKGLLNQESDNLTDPVGKVQNWLLKSHQSLPKSKSTPAGLTDKSRSPHKRLTTKTRNENKKSQSIGNLSCDKDKVRLQVVYKPPFKFSVKLKKPEKLPSVVVVESRAVMKKPRTAVLVRNSNSGNKEREKDKEKSKKNAIKPSNDENIGNSSKPTGLKSNNLDDIDSNIHTVQSDLEVLLSGPHT